MHARVNKRAQGTLRHKSRRPFGETGAGLARAREEGTIQAEYDLDIFEMKH